MTIYALTSLSPSPDRVERQRACIASWRAAGLRVVSFNHPSELAALRGAADVDFVAVQETSESVFGRPLVPISAFLEWAAAERALVLLINSDIELRLAPWELRRIRWLCEGGLCSFQRYNHGPSRAQAWREQIGIDAFFFDGARAPRLPRSFLSMGQPFWDFWLPRAFAAAGMRLWSVEFPAAFHQEHPQSWSWENWSRCALEFDRLAQVLGGDHSLQACHEMSARVRHEIQERSVALPRQPTEIVSWVKQRFGGAEKKSFLELGAHRGTDTAWMAALPNVTLHGFEPDPRNQVPSLPNVVFNRAAVSDRDGRCSLLLSREGWGREWTYSSSIKQPKNHLARYPVSFGETVEVETVALDTYCRKNDLRRIDFIWADIQGAEGEMVRGARETLRRTHYLYTEYSDDEMYQGQATLSELMALLPGFRVVDLWEDDVLLENQRW